MTRGIAGPLGVAALAATLLAGCGTPHPLDGLRRTGTAEAAGHRYRVNWNAEAAQVTRLNPAWRPPFAEVARGALMAAEQVTGCRALPRTVQGDVALVNMTLDCTGAG